MMGATGEPSAYYPMDSNGLAVQNAPAQPCICAVVSLSRTAGCLFPKCGILLVGGRPS